MKSASWVGVIAAAVLFGILRLGRGLASEPRRPASDGAAAPASLVLDATAAGVESAPAAHDGSRREASPATTPEAAGAAGTWRVRARLCDAEGRPLVGAELVQGHAGAELVALAGADGFAELVLGDGARPALTVSGEELYVFRARAAHHRETLRHESRPAAGLLELGEMRLYPIGALGGRVVDEVGRGLAGAEVRLVPPLQEDAARARLFGPQYSRAALKTKSAADGRFRFEDVPIGAWRPWAGASTRAWSHGEVVRLDPAEACEEILLVLAPLGEEELIRGTVRGPTGALAGVEVDGRRESAEVVESWTLSDADGRFVLPAFAGTPHRLWTRAVPQRALPSAELADVWPGRGEVLLALPTARFLEVELVTADGSPLTEAWVREQHGAELGSRVRAVAGEPGHGRARLMLPAQPFVLEVGGEAYAPLALGPFDPATVPSSMTVELAALARLRGRVSSAGQPVADARVQLMQLEPPGEVSFLYGFPTRLSGRDLRGVKSDRDGRFELPIPFRGACALLAEKDGYAPSELALALDPTRSLELELELGQGGGVEGQVRVPAGEDPSGIAVRLCRGDMRVHEAISDARGFYRLERLAPGPYMVSAGRLRAGKALRGGASVIETLHDEGYRFPWALEVRAGEITRHDVTLDGGQEATLSGVLTIDGAGPGSAVARLVPAGEDWLVRSFEHEEVVLDSSGSFRFASRRPQAVVLVLEPSSGTLAGTRIVAPLELAAGETRFELALASAVLESAPPSSAAGAWAWLGEPARGVATLTPVSNLGARARLTVPAGVLRLVGQRPADRDPDPRTWSEFRRVEVAPGAVTRLE